MRFLLVFGLLFSSALSAQVPDNPPIPNDTSRVTIDAQASIARSSTECSLYAATTAINVWANAPTEVKTVAVLSNIRYVTIQNVTESLTPFATGYVSIRVGPTTNSPVMSLINGYRLFSGAFYQPEIRRPNGGAQYGNVFPTGPMPIWVYPQSAVTLCVTYSW